MKLPIAFLPGLALGAAAETWTELAAIAGGTLREHSTAAVPGKIITVGGVVTGGATTNMIQIYDIQSNAWSKASVTLPVPINHGNVASVNGKVYLLMGLTSTGAAYTWKSTPTSGIYDPKADTWTALEGLPAAQARGAAALG